MEEKEEWREGVGGRRKDEGREEGKRKEGVG